MSSFEIPSNPNPDRNFQAEYEELLRIGAVNAVNHGEFEEAVTLVIEQARKEDKGRARASALAIQRCRRGGKTFMLHAVASMLVTNRTVVDDGIQVLFISMNSTSAYNPDGEDAYTAILSRVGWEISGREPKSFQRFKDKYNDFGAVDEWLTTEGNRVILIVDELNMIRFTMGRYGDMSCLLDNFVQQKGCALLYSTHQRGTADLLRGRRPGSGNDLTLSKRQHVWLSIPRIVNEKCLHGLMQNPAEQPSFWCAVLRGRVPALVLQTSEIASYASEVFQDPTSEEERTSCLAAVITGKIDSLPNAHNLFRSYSYMSERFTDGEKTLFAWPVFMVAQRAVLGKDYRRLCATLENPDIDGPKAFEALVQLAVIVRLLSEQQHPLVPPNPEIREANRSAFEGTEMFHVAESVTTIDDIIDAVSARYSRAPQVLQVVAVPMFASFPTYDFFLLHKCAEGWKVAAGYQCKQGTETPSEDAWPEVCLSVWIEGKCRKYRVQEDGKRVSEKLHRGWVLLGESGQADVLGVSVSEALPQDPMCEENPCCFAEMAWKDQEEQAVAGEKSAKKARTNH
jgi:hypothetical protein